MCLSAFSDCRLLVRVRGSGPRCAYRYRFIQGEICPCPSRLLIQEDICDKLMPRLVQRVKAIQLGHPLDPSTMMGAQVSEEQHDKIRSYLAIGKAEGARVLTGGAVSQLGAELSGGSISSRLYFTDITKCACSRHVDCTLRSHSADLT